MNKTNLVIVGVLAIVEGGCLQAEQIDVDLGTAKQYRPGADVQPGRQVFVEPSPTIDARGISGDPLFAQLSLEELTGLTVVGISTTVTDCLDSGLVITVTGTQVAMTSKRNARVQTMYSVTDFVINPDTQVVIESPGRAVCDQNVSAVTLNVTVD